MQVLTLLNHVVLTLLNHAGVAIDLTSQAQKLNNSIFTQPCHTNFTQPCRRGNWTYVAGPETNGTGLFCLYSRSLLRWLIILYILYIIMIHATGAAVRWLIILYILYIIMIHATGAAVRWPIILHILYIIMIHATGAAVRWRTGSHVSSSSYDTCILLLIWHMSGAAVRWRTGSHVPGHMCAERGYWSWYKLYSTISY
jgi:hypothetical protein